MKNDNVHIGKLIVQKLDEIDRPVTWLAERARADNSNLGKILKGNRYIDLDLLFRISAVLEQDFFAYYSEKLKENQSK